MRMVIVEGVPYPSITAACRAYGVITNAVYVREKRGVTIEQAILEEVAYSNAHNEDSFRCALERDKAEAVGLVAPYVRRVAKSYNVSFDEALSIAQELYRCGGRTGLAAQEYSFCRKYQISERTYDKVMRRLKTRELTEKFIVDTLEDKCGFVFGSTFYNNLAAFCDTYPVVAYTRTLHRKLTFDGSYTELIHILYWVIDDTPYRLLRDAGKALGLPNKVVLSFSRKREYKTHDEAIQMMRELVEREGCL